MKHPWLGATKTVKDVLSYYSMLLNLALLINRYSNGSFANTSILQILLPRAGDSVNWLLVDYIFSLLLFLQIQVFPQNPGISWVSEPLNL